MWWIEQGIEAEFTRPASPQDNGAHERMHRDLKAEATQPSSANLAAQQRRFERWRHTYNHERPHESLDQQCPADCYQPTPRRLTERGCACGCCGRKGSVRERESGLCKWECGHQGSEAKFAEANAALAETNARCADADAALADANCGGADGDFTIASPILRGDRHEFAALYGVNPWFAFTLSHQLSTPKKQPVLEAGPVTGGSDPGYIVILFLPVRSKNAFCGLGCMVAAEPIMQCPRIYTNEIEPEIQTY